MNFPITTGRAAALLEVTEPSLGEIVRRGRVSPAPPVLAGRRLWEADHLLQAAEALDLLTDEVRQRIEALAHSAKHDPQPHLPFHTGSEDDDGGR